MSRHDPYDLHERACAAHERGAYADARALNARAIEHNSAAELNFVTVPKVTVLKP